MKKREQLERVSSLLQSPVLPRFIRSARFTKDRLKQTLSGLHGSIKLGPRLTYRATKITDFEKAFSTPEKRSVSDSHMASASVSLKGFKIQVTNSFTIQFSYLSQFLQYAAKNHDRPKILRSEYVTHLGLTKRHAEAVCSVAVAFDLVVPKKLTVTKVGKTMAEGDPYLEYTGTLWTLHYNVASNKKWLIWNTLLNEVFPTRQKIKPEEARESFSGLREKLSKFTMNKKVRREIAIILDSYTTKSFSKLGIIQKEDSAYILHKTDQIPPEILTATTLVFRQRYDPNASGVSMETLVKAPNSPGRILNMEESTMRRIFEQANHRGLLFIERKADLDQIRFREGITVETLLKMYYEGLKK